MVKKIQRKVKNHQVRVTHWLDWSKVLYAISCLTQACVGISVAWVLPCAIWQLNQLSNLPEVLKVLLQGLLPCIFRRPFNLLPMLSFRTLSFVIFVGESLR